MASKTSVAVATAAKREKALQLRLAGASYQQIADAVGYASRGAAHNVIREEIEKIPKDAAKQLLTMELERLDAAQAAIWKDVRRGDPIAVASLIKIIDMRAKLTGIYNPQPEGNTEDVKTALLAFLAGAKAGHSGGNDGPGDAVAEADRVDS